jgi:LacI family transcriptional regulator
MPIVFVDRIVDDIDTHKVSADNFKGAYNATQHLIECGYRRIAAITNPESLSISKERLAGYRAALIDNGITIDDAMIKFCQHGGMIFQEVQEVVDELLELEDKPTAIFAAADKLTTNCLRIFKAKGISVPDEMGLIGFSNIDLAELIEPPLSVVRQPAFEMGEVATKLLLQIIESKRPVTDFETKVLSTELLIRGSTKKFSSKAKQTV